MYCRRKLRKRYIPIFTAQKGRERMRVIAGKVRGKPLKTPNGLSTRPTTDRVKEAMFSIIHFELPGADILDLFAGTGQLGIEGLSRGANRVTFVDAQESACRLIRENVKACGFQDQARIVRSDYLSFLNQCSEKYNIILLDPPYAEVFLENSLKRISEIDILQSDGIIVTERPVGKGILCEIPGFTCSRDYKYGSTLLTIFRKDGSKE